MTYFLELKHYKDIAQIEADADSPLEELSARIKVAFNLPYDDYNDHEFSFNGHIYVPEDLVDRVREVNFETWEPDDTREEPDWFDLYRSSDDITLRDAFTVLGSAINYKQGWSEVRITLIDRDEEDETLESKYDKYDYLQDKMLNN